MKLLAKLNCLFILAILICPMFFCGCSNQKIKLYDIQTQEILTLSLEDYVAGVTAAEIDTSFSNAAIASQSVLARTFALWFIGNSKSKYDGADISNDITEAQAYTSNIPDKIQDICKTTKGQVLKFNGELFLPYYCSNCGGKSSLAEDVFSGNNTAYTSSVSSLETNENSQNFQWEATIEKSSILYATSKLGISLASVSSFEKGKQDASGRCLSFIIAGKEVNANDFRLSIGSTILKSCKIDDISISTSSITFSGTGYGHGVGLSQWGANILATQNKTYKEILEYFYPKCKLVKT